MPFRFGVIVGIAVSCSALAADDFQDWTAAVHANEDHAARVIGSFRIQSTNDFLRLSNTIREANAKLGVNVDLPVIEVVEVDVRGRWMLRRWKDRKGTECVTGQNSKYVFDIEKAAGGSSYTITRLEYHSADVTLDPDVSEHRFTIFPECYAFGQNLKQLMLDPGFRFGKVSEVLGIDGKKLKRISFEYVPTTEGRMQIENATIDCDAAQGWTIVGGKGDFWKSIIKDYEFANTVTTPEGFGKMTILIPAGDPDSCRRTTHVVESLERVPQEAEFFLAYYGLREPGVAATWSFRWVVLMIVGVAIIWFSIRWGKGRASGR